jgi:hypothetical protein
MLLRSWKIYYTHELLHVHYMILHALQVITPKCKHCMQTLRHWQRLRVTDDARPGARSCRGRPGRQSQPHRLGESGEAEPPGRAASLGLSAAAARLCPAAQPQAGPRLWPGTMRLP